MTERGYQVALLFTDPDSGALHRFKIGQCPKSEVTSRIKATIEEWRDGCTLPLYFIYKGFVVHG